MNAPIDAATAQQVAGSATQNQGNPAVRLRSGRRGRTAAVTDAVTPSAKIINHAIVPTVRHSVQMSGVQRMPGPLQEVCNSSGYVELGSRKRGAVDLAFQGGRRRRRLLRQARGRARCPGRLDRSGRRHRAGPEVSALRPGRRSRPTMWELSIGRTYAVTIGWHGTSGIRGFGLCQGLSIVRPGDIPDTVLSGHR